MNKTHELEQKICLLTERAEAVMLGRAAWGLFALLSVWKKTNSSSKIAMPSFLCQSPLAAVLLAGWSPEFLDVDPLTGNVSNAEWDRAFDQNIDAVLFVHMFGNASNADIISAQCRAKNILFIEDAAQALGASIESKICGSFGDASLISFGHTKLVNAGGGGAIVTNDEKLAKEVRNFGLKYAFLDFDRQKYAESFIKKFYSCRRLVTSSLSEAKYSFSGIIFDYKNLISLKWNCHLAEEILKKLNNLPKLVSESRKKNDLYVSELKGSPLVPLNFSKYSVPWRSVFRLPGIDWRQQFDISESVRKEGVDISNWYIPSHWMMDGLNSRNLDLRETEQLSREVFQFWVDETANEVSIKHAASIMKKTLGC